MGVQGTAAAGRGWREAGTTFLQLAGLTTFAAVGPFLSVLQTGPTFFVAQGLSGLGLVLYVLGWLVVPAAVMTLLVWLAGRWRPSFAMALRTTLVGLLAGLAVVGVLPGSLEWRSWLFVGVWLVAAALGALAFSRLAIVRSLVTASAIAVPVFAIGFLASGAVRSLVAPEATAVELVSRNDNPVVVLVFDEMGLGTILTPEGEINAALFPNFERLAATSTWYPEATTVAPWTYLAMPALLAGALPEEGSLPTSSVWPRNVLALSGDEGDVVTYEYATAFCPPDTCRDDGGAEGRLWSDSITVLVHSVLPQGLADRLVPAIGAQWAGFGRESGAQEAGSEQSVDPVALQQGARAELIDRFGDLGSAGYAQLFIDGLSDLGPGDSALLHLELPHLPGRYVADGTRYDGDGPVWFPRPGATGDDPAGAVGHRQRLLLQTMFVDRILGEVLDELTRLGILDETLLIVASDHGLSFQPSSHRRARDIDSRQEVLDEVLPVPLFIKAPGQTEGVRDARDARIVDVLPTVLDLLEVQTAEPWELDGQSLLGEPVEGRPRWFIGVGEFPLAPDPVAAARRQAEALGPRAMRGEMYAIGPYADLVGRPAGDPVVAGLRGAAQAAPTTAWEEVDPASGYLPLLVSVTDPVGVSSGDWMAAVLNGVVAGVGSVFAGPDGRLIAEIMVDPSTVVPGSNDLAVFAIASPEGPAVEGLG